MNPLIIKKNKVIPRSPRLETVFMVEDFIEKNSGNYNQMGIFKNLPKKMMWQTFKLILNYLTDINKIILNKDGTITWIWNPKLVEKYLQNNNLEVKI